MPTYTIQTPDGRKIKIEAADEATAMRGAREWSQKNAAKPAQRSKTTGFLANVNRGTGIGDEMAAGFQAAGNIITGKEKINPLALVPFMINGASMFGNESGNAFLEASGLKRAGRNAMAEQRVTEDAYAQSDPLKARFAQGVGNAATVAVPGAPMVKTLQTGNALANAGRFGIAAATEGAAYGLADRGTAEERVGAAKTNALFSAVLGSGIGAAVTRRAAPKVQAAKAPSIDELRASKNAAYKAADDAGVAYSPEAIDSLAQGVGDDLRAANLDDALHPRATALLKRLEGMRGKPLTLTQIDQFRQLAGEVAASADKGERRLGRLAIQSIDEFLDAATPAQALTGDAARGAGLLTEARGLNQKVAKIDTINEAVNKAELRAGSTGSGGNVNNAMRQNLRRVLESGRGYSAEEREALKAIVMGTPGQNFLRQVGKLSPEGNGLMAGLNLGAAGMTSGASIPVSAAGMVAKRLADRGTEQRVAALVDLIASGGPKAIQAEREFADLAARDPAVAEIYELIAAKLTRATGVGAGAAIATSPQ